MFASTVQAILFLHPSFQSPQQLPSFTLELNVNNNDVFPTDQENGQFLSHKLSSKYKPRSLFEEARVNPYTNQLFDTRVYQNNHILCAQNINSGSYHEVNIGSSDISANVIEVTSWLQWIYLNVSGVLFALITAWQCTMYYTPHHFSALLIQVSFQSLLFTFSVLIIISLSYFTVLKNQTELGKIINLQRKLENVTKRLKILSAEKEAYHAQATEVASKLKIANENLGVANLQKDTYRELLITLEEERSDEMKKFEDKVSKEQVLISDQAIEREKERIEKELIRQEMLCRQEVIKLQKKFEEKSEESRLLEEELITQKLLWQEQAIELQRKHERMSAKITKMDVVLKETSEHKERYSQQASELKGKNEEISTELKILKQRLEVMSMQNSMCHKQVRDSEGRARVALEELDTVKQQLKVVSAQKDACHKEFKTMEKENEDLMKEVKKLKQNLKITIKQKEAHCDETKEIRGKNLKVSAELKEVKEKLELVRKQKELYCDELKDLWLKNEQGMVTELKKVKQILEVVTVSENNSTHKISPYEINQDMYEVCWLKSSGISYSITIFLQICSGDAREKMDKFKQK